MTSPSKWVCNRRVPKQTRNNRGFVLKHSLGTTVVGAYAMHRLWVAAKEEHYASNANHNRRALNTYIHNHLPAYTFKRAIRFGFSGFWTADVWSNWGVLYVLARCHGCARCDLCSQGTLWQATDSIVIWAIVQGLSFGLLPGLLLGGRPGSWFKQRCTKRNKLVVLWKCSVPQWHTLKTLLNAMLSMDVHCEQCRSMLLSMPQWHVLCL